MGKFPNFFFVIVTSFVCSTQWGIASPSYEIPKSFIAPSAASSLRQEILKKAFDLRGKPYVWNGHGPDGFDCSGFVWYVLRSVLGEARFPLQYEFKNDSRPQSVIYRDFLESRGARISCDAINIADIVFFPASPGDHNHIGLITEPREKNFITAQQRGVGVREGSFGPRGFWSLRNPECFRNIWAD